MHNASTAERGASSNDSAPPTIRNQPFYGFAPRLLTGPQAAIYLGFKSPELLRNVPVKPVQLSVVGVGRAPRWDRVALDRWLDGLSLLEPEPEPGWPGGDGELEAELDVWRAGRGF